MFDITPVTSNKYMDCGATCMKMLLAYYGEDVDLDALIKECNTRMIGCSGTDLMRVARAHGLDAKTFQMDAEELIRQDRPAIIWWKYGHWCVFCGKDEAGNVAICNPDRGRYRMSQGIFTSFYSGVAIFNGEPVDLPEDEEATAKDYAEALGLLGVVI